MSDDSRKVEPNDAASTEKKQMEKESTAEIDGGAQTSKPGDAENEAAGENEESGVGDGMGIPVADSIDHVLNTKTAEPRSWRIFPSRDMNTCFLDYVPQNEEEPPTGADLRAEVEALGAQTAGLFPEETLDLLLENARRTNRELKAYPICEPMDGEFSIDVSEDKLKATLFVRKGRGQGKTLALKEVGTAIRTVKFKNLDVERVKTDILSFQRSKEPELIDYILAEGKPPEKGKDRTIAWHATFLTAELIDEHKKRAAELLEGEELGLDQPDEEELPEDQLEDGQTEGDQALDFASESIGMDTISDGAKKELISLQEHPISVVAEMAQVHVDEIVAELSEPDLGNPGEDVYGKVVNGIAGDDLEFNLLENVKIDRNNIVAQIDGLLDKWSVEDITFLRVRPYREASISLEISKDSMEASLSLVQGIGTGKRLSEKFVKDGISEAGVYKGIDEEAVAGALGMARKECEVSGFVIATGKPVGEGEEARLSLQVDIASGKGVTIKEDGSADFKNQDRLTVVQEGQLIAEIIPPGSKPEDGWDVRGNDIRSKEPPPLKLAIGENIRQEEADGGTIKLYAGTSGEVFYDESNLSITQAYAIKGDVNLSTGNIKFAGAVAISGNVTSGFYVMAGGPVSISEGVEAALVSSEDSIQIQGGVIGGGKAVIRSKKDIQAAFAEQARMLAVEDIAIKNACLRCNIKTNGSLKLTTEKGHLVGGLSQAKLGINVANLGAESGTETRISFGQDYLIGDRIDLEERELEKLKEKQTAVEFEIRQMEKDKDRRGLEDARKEKLGIMKGMEKRSERLLVLRERFERHYPSEITVRGTAFPGVIMESHGRTHEVTEPRKGVIYFFNSENGHIEEKIT